MRSAYSSQPGDPTQSLQGAGEEGQATASPAAEGHDGIVEVEDAGLEGGQEGVTQGVTAAEPVIKQETLGDDNQHHTEAEQKQQDASTSDPTQPAAVKGELQARPELPDTTMPDSRASEAIFGSEIALPEQARMESSEGASEAIFGSEIALPEQSNHQPGEEAGPSHQQAPDSTLLDVAVHPDDVGVAAGSIQNPNAEASPVDEQPISVQTCIVVCREEGTLEIFALPEMQLLFSYSNAVEGPPLLTQGGSSPSSLRKPGEEAEVHIVEARMESFGANVSGQQCYATLLLFLFHKHPLSSLHS